MRVGIDRGTCGKQDTVPSETDITTVDGRTLMKLNEKSNEASWSPNTGEWDE
jgi:hypothetical protein